MRNPSSIFVLLFNAARFISSVEPIVESWKSSATLLKVSAISDVVGQHGSRGNITAIENMLVGKGIVYNGSY